jgi:hypothetical protein
MHGLARERIEGEVRSKADQGLDRGGGLSRPGVRQRMRVNGELHNFWVPLVNE